MNSLAGETPLHIAARCSNVFAVEKLLRFGADVNAVDHCGRTPLIASVAAVATEVVKVGITLRFHDLHLLENSLLFMIETKHFLNTKHLIFL